MRYSLNVKGYSLNNPTSGQRFPLTRIVAWPDGTIRAYAAEGKQVYVAVEGTGTWQRGIGTFTLIIDGETWEARHVGCACGSPLKRWPYEGLPA